MSALAALLDAVENRRDRWKYAVDYDRDRRERIRDGKLIVTPADAANTMIAADERQEGFNELLVQDARDETMHLTGSRRAIDAPLAALSQLAAAAKIADSRNESLEGFSEWTELNRELAFSRGWLYESGAINLGRGSLEDIIQSAATALQALDERWEERDDQGAYVAALREINVSVTTAANNGNLRWLEDQNKISRETADDLMAVIEGAHGRELRETLKRALARIHGSDAVLAESRDEAVMRWIRSLTDTWQAVDPLRLTEVELAAAKTLESLGHLERLIFTVDNLAPFYDHEGVKKRAGAAVIIRGSDEFHKYSKPRVSEYGIRLTETGRLVQLTLAEQGLDTDRSILKQPRGQSQRFEVIWRESVDYGLNLNWRPELLAEMPRLQWAELKASPQAVSITPLKRRRRRAERPAKPLTAKQTEALQIVGECKGNLAEAAGRLGIDRKSLKERYDTALKKLGRTHLKYVTEQIRQDLRGQANVAEEDDRRRG